MSSILSQNSSNFIQIKKIEYNDKFIDQTNFEEENDEYNELASSKSSDKKSSWFINLEKSLEKWEVYHSQGYSARKSENYTLAIDWYTKSLNMNPKYFKALFNRGFAFDKMNQFDKAIADYSKAIEVEPNNAYAYYNRAISYEKKGDIDKTLIDFTKAITLLPTKIDFYLNRAHVYRKIKEYPLAVRDYTEVIKYEKDNIKVF